jgi:type II secretory pathway component GspD/PulD (secretin)
VACLCLVLGLTAACPSAAVDEPRVRFTFENADIKTVIAEVARLTGTTFLFDPTRVTGTITAFTPGEVTPARALELLRSALALHGYEITPAPGGMWIVPARGIARREFVVRVVRLTYADAGEVAATLSWVAPPGVRIVPHLPTNSVVIAGHVSGVDEMIDAIDPRQPR